jgi:dihydrofolate reductase
MIRLITAVDNSNAIGWSSGELPWRVSADMKRFKALTDNSTVVMGFRTFKSLGRAEGLPNRRNIVLSSRPYSQIREHVGLTVEVISSFRWIEAHQQCLGCTPPDLWIIGGAEVYRQALESGMVDEIHLTRIHANSNADVKFPVDFAAWKSFILAQQQKGIFWDVADPIEDAATQDQPSSTYLVFRKIK